MACQQWHALRAACLVLSQCVSCPTAAGVLIDCLAYLNKSQSCVPCLSSNGVLCTCDRFVSLAGPTAVGCTTCGCLHFDMSKLSVLGTSMSVCWGTHHGPWSDLRDERRCDRTSLAPGHAGRSAASVYKYSARRSPVAGAYLQWLLQNANVSCT